MTSLASRLNDLAVAHAQQLITYVFVGILASQLTLPSDDDYRLLRHDLFQKHSNDQLSLPQPPVPQPSQPQTPSDLPLRRKLSVVSGFSGFFFRAIGRSPKKHLPMAQTVVTHHHIQQKPSFLSLRRSEQQQKHRQKQHQLPSSAPHDSDGNSAVLMALITSTEAEYTRLLDAFTSLESSTLKRIQYKTARRLYTPTPTSINVLIEGREWRKHTEPVPSIVLPPLSSVPIHYRHHPHSRAHSQHQPSSLSTSSSVADQSSIHSAASSSKISISGSSPSHNANNFAVPLLSSSLSTRAHAHPLQRQNSVSSASTQSTGANSHPQTPGPRSVGNLYHLTSPADRKLSAGIRADHIAEEDGPLDDTDDDPEAADYESAMRELNDIRRRKEDVNARFVRRMDYLKAQLQAAELREHVMHRWESGIFSFRLLSWLFLTISWISRVLDLMLLFLNVRFRAVDRFCTILS